MCLRWGIGVINQTGCQKWWWGLLENMREGEAKGWNEEEGESLSVIHTLSPNAISPECQAEMRGGADKTTVHACVPRTHARPQPQDARHGPNSHYVDMIEFAPCVTSLSSMLDKVL